MLILLPLFFPLKSVLVSTAPFLKNLPAGRQESKAKIIHHKIVNLFFDRYWGTGLLT